MNEMYFFTQVQVMNDDTTIQAVFKYDTYNEALTAYHSFMFSGMSNENIKGLIAVIVDHDCMPRIRDKWERNPINDEEPVD